MKFGPYGKTLMMKATNPAGIYMRFQSITDANIVAYWPQASPLLKAVGVGDAVQVTCDYVGRPTCVQVVEVPF